MVSVRYWAVDFMNLGADVVAIGVWNGMELAKLDSIRKPGP